MDSKVEELYARLHSLRQVMLDELNKWPEHLRRESALYTLKMLQIEMEHLPSIVKLNKLEGPFS